MGDTEISWTHRPGTVGRTWNPVQGCRRISPGCEHCYAERTAARFAEKGWSQGLINLKTKKWNGEVRLAAHKLEEPFSWRKPSTVFVNSMSDLFHDGFTNEQIAAVFAVMAAAWQHTYQILTKRARRMREWFEWIGARDVGSTLSDALWRVDEHAFDEDWLASVANYVNGWSTWAEVRDGNPLNGSQRRWPLRNVWLGVSAENQETADERLPELRAVPAVVHMVSCEPLLGPIDLEPHLDHLQWVIAGAESGPGSRGCDVAWLRWLREQCEVAGVAFFAKQAYDTSNEADDRTAVSAGDGSKRKGRGLIELPYLDGVQHAQFPELAR